MSSVENVEWLNLNALRTYPIHEDSDVVPYTSSGQKLSGVRIPTCLVVDFAFTLVQNDIKEDVRLGLTGITHAGGSFSFEISANSGGVSTVACVFSAKIGDHTPNRTYKLVGTGAYDDCTGWITLGDLEKAAEELPEGLYRFNPGQVDFELSTLRMSPRGVRSISAVGKYGMVAYRQLYGRVRIVGGMDIALAPDSDHNGFWIKASSKSGYETSEGCVCDAGAVRNVVETINGMPVEHVTIVGDTCIDVSDDRNANTVTISNACGTPCCGCAELQFVDSAVSTLNQSISSLESFARSLHSKLEYVQNVAKMNIVALNAYPGTKDRALRGRS